MTKIFNAEAIVQIFPDYSEYEKTVNIAPCLMVLPEYKIYDLLIEVKGLIKKSKDLEILIDGDDIKYAIEGLYFDKVDASEETLEHYNEIIKELDDGLGDLSFIVDSKELVLFIKENRPDAIEYINNYDPKFLSKIEKKNKGLEM